MSGDTGEWSAAAADVDAELEADGLSGDVDDYYWDGSCQHDHDDDCYDYQGFFSCRHMHCVNCGECQCAGYCDDYQTYNLRPSETGGAA
jgi:hypothetical protein